MGRGGLGLGQGLLSLLRPQPLPSPFHGEVGRPPHHAFPFLPVVLEAQGVVSSLVLGLKPPRMAADVGDRAATEVSPENFSETRVTAVTGWWGNCKGRLTGRGLGGSGAEVWAPSVGPSPGPGMCDQERWVNCGGCRNLRHTTQEVPAPLSPPLPGRPDCSAPDLPYRGHPAALTRGNA